MEMNASKNPNDPLRYNESIRVLEINEHINECDEYDWSQPITEYGEYLIEIDELILTHEVHDQVNK